MRVAILWVIAVVAQFVGAVLTLLTWSRAIPLTTLQSIFVTSFTVVAFVAAGALKGYRKRMLATTRAEYARGVVPSAVPAVTGIVDPVVYLRPFRIDGSEVGLYYGQHQTMEEALLKALEPVGAAIAIGRPGEHLSEAGALRLYYSSDTEWRQAVNRMIANCKLCVLVAGGSAGVQWELSRCVSMLPPQKLLIFFAPAKNPRAAYDEFCSASSKIVRLPLPPYVRGTMFVRFDSDWQAHLLTEGDAPLWVRANQTTEGPAGIYTSILGPVFASLGIDNVSKVHGGPSKGFRTAIKVVFWIAVVLFGVLLLTRKNPH